VCCGVETGVDAEGEHYQRGGAREARPYLRADRLTQLVGQPLSPHLSMFLRCVHHFVAKRFFFLSRHSLHQAKGLDESIVGKTIEVGRFQIEEWAKSTG